MSNLAKKLFENVKFKVKKSDDNDSSFNPYEASDSNFNILPPLSPLQESQEFIYHQSQLVSHLQGQ